MKTQITDFKGFEQMNFMVSGRESLIVKPKKPLEGNPWILRTEFFGAFDYADMALLEQGWHLAYHNVSNMYGCDQSIDMLHEFVTLVIGEFQLKSKVVVFGFSRGGLYAVNFSVKYPELVSGIYIDAPVLNILSWPGGKFSGVGDENCWKECMECYGIDENSAEDFKGNPLNKTDILKQNNIPVILVAGDADEVVPFNENGEIFYNKYKNSGLIKLIVKHGIEHHPHSLENPAEIVDYINSKM